MKWWTQGAEAQAIADRTALVNTLNSMIVQIRQLERRITTLEERLHDDGK